MAQVLLLIQHALLVLGNLLLVVGNVVPVDLAGSLVHRVLVQSLHLLFGVVDYLADHDLGLVQISVVERHSQVLPVNAPAFIILDFL